ncbi:MAG: hypothetical protein IV101_02000 [Dechloromonas sp.]|nr:hypothetical protein [Dechloromonas sp.]
MLPTGSAGQFNAMGMARTRIRRCGKAHCYGQPEKMAKIEIIGASVRHDPKRCPIKCQLQFQPKIHTVRFVVRELSKICEPKLKIIPAQLLLAVLSASLLDRFSD